MKVLVFFSILTILTACGGDSGGNKNKIEDFIGVWDWTKTTEEGTDEYYIVITEDKVLIHYDYLGDSFDEGSDCYDKYISGELMLLDNGYYQAADDPEKDEVKLTRSGETLTMEVSGDTDVENTISSGVLSDLTEEDFTPLCVE